MRPGFAAFRLYDAVVERITRAERAAAVAAAAGHELNNELTVILSTVSDSLETLEPDHPARPELLELQDAARRCARTSSELLRFGLKRRLRPASTSFAELLREE